MFYENELGSHSPYLIDAFVQDNLRSEIDVHLHWHDCFELLYVYEGEAVQKLNSKVFTTRPGDLIVIKKGDIHSTTCKREDDVKIFVVKFLPSFIDSIFPSEYDSIYISSFLNLQASPVKSIANSEQADYIINIFKMMVNEFSKKQRGFETSLKGLLTVLINEIIRLGLLEFEYDLASVNTQDKTKSNINELLKMIENNYTNIDFSLKDIAKYSHYNYSYCSRYFKKRTGKGFLEFLNFVRICEAEKLMISTDYSMTKIACECGFASIISFSRTYKRVRGYPPTFIKKVKN